MRFVQMVSGQERKAIAALIGEATGHDVRYEGAPGFGYEVGGWRIEKTGLLRSPEFQPLERETIRPVLDALKIASLTTEGDLTLILQTEGHTGITIRNLINMIASKQTLLRKALGREQAIIPADFVEAINTPGVESLAEFTGVLHAWKEEHRIDSFGDLWLDHMPSEIGLCFFKATIEADRVLSYILLAWKLNELAKTLKYASPKQKDTDNDKYAMRCWLLRLGFIGDECKTERKILLKNLEGNSAFRQIT